MLETPPLTPPASNPTASGFLRRATAKFATTLAAPGIDATTDTIPLTSTTDLSTDSAVTIVIDPETDKEEVLIGFPESTNLVNVVRGVEGSAVAHDAGAVVQMWYCAIDLNSIIDWARVEHDGDGHHTDITATSIVTDSLEVDGKSIAEIASPPGSISMFAGAAAPDGFLLCDGASLLRADYADLFAVIGTTFGAADGTHFTLPNLKGKVPVGRDSGQTEFDTLGETGGEKTHTLTTNEMPVHAHGVNDPGHSHGFSSGIGFGAGPGNAGLGRADLNSPGTIWSNFFVHAAGTGISIQNAGSGGAHNNLQPYLVLNYIIKT